MAPFTEILAGAATLVARFQSPNNEIHDNILTFNSSISHIHSASFTITDFMVTDDKYEKDRYNKGSVLDLQNNDKHVNAGDGFGTINIRAANNGIEEITNTWHNKWGITGSYTTNEVVSKDVNPKSLDFAFLGNLVIHLPNDHELVTSGYLSERIELKDIAFAQGPTTPSEEEAWWFGGKHCKAYSKENTDDDEVEIGCWAKDGNNPAHWAIVKFGKRREDSPRNEIWLRDIPVNEVVQLDVMDHKTARFKVPW